MAQHARILVVALAVLAMPILVMPMLAAAQQPPSPAPARPRKPSNEKTNAAATTPREAADPLAELRRTTAISLVNSLADEARNYRSPTVSARTQARAADVLWEIDRERARVLFRRAWDAAENADRENDRLMDEEKRKQEADRGYYSVRSLPSLRREVLRLAARRDRALGEEFLATMDEARKQENKNTATNAAPDTASNNASTRANPQEPPPAVAQRLRLAMQLLEDDDVERAIQFADTVLNSVNVPAIEFLVRLRHKNPDAADQRYTALLARAATDPASDANTVSMLSSYVFTPSFYITFEPGGGASSSRMGQPPRPEVSAMLRNAFFNTAAAILLRPLPPPDQDKSSAGRAGTYMVIARLTPLFEQYMPDKVAPLRAQLAALQPDTSERSRDPRNSAFTRGLVAEDPNRDRVQEALDRLPEARTSAERDEVYFNAAQSAVSHNDPRARELADKIEDIDFRKQVRAYIDFEMTEKAVRDKNADEALRLARSGELSPVQRTWATTEAAQLLAKDEPGRAIETLEQALTEARRIDAASIDRVRALVAIATRLAPLDIARTWEIMSEAVKAANSLQEFTGEDAFLMVRVQSKNSTTISSSSVDSFDLNGIFTTLGKADLARAVELAKSFTAESPRAVATLSVARSVLDTKKKVVVVSSQ
ncbi:MAG TPA: hypothetical protein VF666_11100 [Pyrinomonadaceae bacterium]|jgi:hypothetical protein